MSVYNKTFLKTHKSIQGGKIHISGLNRGNSWQRIETKAHNVWGIVNNPFS